MYLNSFGRFHEENIPSTEYAILSAFLGEIPTAREMISL
jgi:hypothetical protein